jgi:hypothetical protein
MMMMEEQRKPTFEDIAATFDTAMNTLSETIGYLRAEPKTLLWPSQSHMLANRLDQARTDL